MPARLLPRRLRAALLVALVTPLPAWAAPGPLPAWVAYALFVGAAIVVLVLLLRDALFDPGDDQQPAQGGAGVRNPQKRYDVRQAVHKTAANRRIA